MQAIMSDVRHERWRQIEKGCHPDHDDEFNSNGELVKAAVIYAMHAARYGGPGAGQYVPPLWPWERASFKPKEHQRNLLRAAALLVAELERLERKREAADRDAVAPPLPGASITETS